MKQLRRRIFAALLLAGLSLLIYLVHYSIFHDVHTVVFYLIMDVAFLPIQVLLATVVINEVLTIREKRNRFKKLNMVIGVFFSEVGTQLLTYLSDFDPNLDSIRKDLIVTGQLDGKGISPSSQTSENIRVPC